MHNFNDNDENSHMRSFKKIKPSRKISKFTVVTENVLHVLTEMVTKYSPIFLANFDQYFFKLLQ